MPLVCAGDMQLQPVLPPREEVGPASLSVVEAGQPMQRRAPVSAAQGRGRSGFDFGAAAGVVRRSGRLRKSPKRLRAVSEGSPSDGSEGSEDRDMPQSCPPLPSGQG